MRGHIRKRGSKYTVIIDAGVTEDGKRRQKWHSGYRTRKDAERALTELLHRQDKGTYIPPTKLTVAQYVRGEWLPAMQVSLKPSTYEGYRRGCPDFSEGRLSGAGR